MKRMRAAALLAALLILLPHAAGAQCPVIGITPGALPAGTEGSPHPGVTFSAAPAGAYTFAATGFPAGMTFVGGVLAGTPTAAGTFPVRVVATEASGCLATKTMPLRICPVITVSNPINAAGTVSSAFSETFTQTGASGTATFTTASTLPAGLTLAANGVLSGTPLEDGTFPIVVTVTDANGCTGTGATYTLVVSCQTITVTNPANTAGTAGSAFSETFTQTGAVGTPTFSTASSLPAGLTLASNGVLSGTPTQTGVFSVVVTVTDSNGCTGTSATYNLSVSCQTITVTNPANTAGTAGSAFSETFTQTGALGSATFTTASTLPAGLSLAANGVLSGTPTQTGVFPIVVTVTDGNGCTGTSATYNLDIACQTITVTNPANAAGTINAAFSETFTQTGAIGSATFTTASTLPAGLTLTAAGVLSGTPTQFGTFPIVVTVTDANGCTGTGATYTLVISCYGMTLAPALLPQATSGEAYSVTFTQSGGALPVTIGLTGTLPLGLSYADPVLSGTPTQSGSFPVTVTATDANGCTVSRTYLVVVSCPATPIAVSPGTLPTVEVSTAYAGTTFTAAGGTGPYTYQLGGALPAGMSFTTDTLTGTPTGTGVFPITVSATDATGCAGSQDYLLVVTCVGTTITVSPAPPLATATLGAAYAPVTFTAAGGTAPYTFAEAGALPPGMTYAGDTLSGTPTKPGTYPLAVSATDAASCSGATAYALTVDCQAITVTNPANANGAAGAAFAETFTQSGGIGTITWSVTGTLPTGITLNSSTGVLSGTTTQPGSFPITVTATDSNGCSGTGALYTLVIACPTITVARNGGGAFPAGVISTVYAGQSVTASGGATPYTFAVTGGALPTGLTLSSAGAISGTPTATGTFGFTVTATDDDGCTGSQSFSIAVAPTAGNDSYSNLVNNTQAAVTGGATSSPTTPFVPLTGSVLANDAPAGGVSAVAGTSATTQGGSVTMAVDGTFLYTPPVTAAALASDTFTYTVASDTGGTGTPGTSTGTVTVNLTNRVWYVKNDGANGNGQSQSPFSSTAPFASDARIGPDTAGDILFVYAGDGTTANHTSGVALLDNEQLIGQGVALVVNGTTLVAAGTAPQVTNGAATSDAVTLANGNTVRGLTITGATRDGIAGVSRAGFTGGTLTISGNAAAGVRLAAMTGAVALTSASISGNGVGLVVGSSTTVGGGVAGDGGTAAITLDGTNQITANAGQRSVLVQNRPAGAGAVALGATITDNGLGIAVNANAAGTIDFTGSQTVTLTGTNQGVALTSNTGATIGFGGTLNVTTATGVGFAATSGGTLNASGTANVTTGAATIGVNLNGVTVGGSGVAFSSVSTTGATTGIALTNVGGTVAVGGGTISGGTTGVSLQGAATSLVLGGVTITGGTTGIRNTTNFGTLTINASVSVSGATALDLTSGTVNGTFANVSSTGGTNGVNLNGITGTWGAAAGSLAGAIGATFNVTGSSGTVTWGGSISQANGANVVTIAGGNANTITFNGNVTSSASSTGLTISGSSGTYAFNGTNAFSGAGGITIGPSQSGSISFSSATTNTTTGTPLFVNGGGGAVTAAITYGGTIAKTSAGRLVEVDNLDAPGTLTMTHAPAVSGDLSLNHAGATGIRVANSSSLNITISNASVTFASAGPGVAASGNTGGTLNLQGLALTGSGTQPGMLISGGGTINLTAGAANPSINLSSGTAASSKAIDGTATAFTGVLNLTNATITGNGTASADIVTLTSSTLGGTGSTISGANRALVLSGVTLTNGAGMASVSSSGGASGISLTNVTGGTYTIAAGSLSSNTGTAFLVSGGSATLTYGGSVTQNTGGQRAVNISGITGGTLTLSGPIGSNGGTGVNIAGTGGTVTISGTMTLNNTGAVYAASGTGLTVNVTGSGNTIGAGTAATGPAVSITNATIGAGGVTFQSVNANGGPRGIYLNSTGAGAFTVTGNGGTCTTATPTCTGGTIQNTTGADDGGTTTQGTGILLVSTTNPSLALMRIRGNANYGIRGDTVAGFTMTNCLIDGTNGTNAASPFNEGSARFTQLTGSASISNTSISGGYADNFRVVNSSGSLNRITFSAVTIGGNDATNGNDGITLEATGAAILNATVENSTFTSAAGDLFQLNRLGSGSSDLVFTGNTLSNNHPNIATGGGGVTISGGDGGSSALTFNIATNTFRDADGHAVLIVKSTDPGSYSGTFTGNTIGVNGVANSGSAAGSGLKVQSAGGGTVNVTIMNNQIRGYNNFGIELLTGGSATAQGGNFYATVTGNTVAQPGTGGLPMNGIHLNGGTVVGDTYQICTNIGGAGALANIITGSGANGGTDFRLRQRQSTTVRLPGYGGAATDTTAVQTFVSGRNGGATGLASVSSPPGGGFIGTGTTCP